VVVAAGGPTNVGPGWIEPATEADASEFAGKPAASYTPPMPLASAALSAPVSDRAASDTAELETTRASTWIWHAVRAHHATSRINHSLPRSLMAIPRITGAVF
jgi:hypothetical protein